MIPMAYGAASIPAMPWTFAAITTALWLKEEGSASSWTDHSGNTRHAVQATTDNQPSLANTLNGLTVRTFDGTNDRMTHPVVETNPSRLTIFAVCNPNGGGMIWSHRDALNGTIIQARVTSTTETTLQLRGSGGGATEILVRTATNNGSAYSIIGGTFDPVADSHELRVNGGTAATSTRDFGSETFNSTINSIGAQDAGSGFITFYIGRIAEMAILLSTPTTDTREKAEGYLAHKWGLTSNLPSGHPYKTNPPFV